MKIFHYLYKIWQLIWQFLKKNETHILTIIAIAGFLGLNLLFPKLWGFLINTKVEIRLFLLILLIAFSIFLGYKLKKPKIVTRTETKYIEKPPVQEIPETHSKFLRNLKFGEFRVDCEFIISGKELTQVIPSKPKCSYCKAELYVERKLDDGYGAYHFEYSCFNCGKFGQNKKLEPDFEELEPKIIHFLTEEYKKGNLELID